MNRLFWLLFAAIFTSSCASTNKSALPKDAPVGLPMQFVDASSITTQLVSTVTTMYRDYQMIGTNYLLTQGGPMTSSATVLTFPTETHLRYQVEGKLRDMENPEPERDPPDNRGSTHCTWKVRVLPFQGTGDIVSTTNGLIDVEFFRVRVLE